MARHRYHAPELVRLFESDTTPLYVLDEQLRIVFVNEACREWLGPAAEELIGRQCVYHSSAELSGPEAAAAGLCPPPTVLSGRAVTAEVARTTGQGAESRRARFLPLGPAGHLLGVVAFLDCPEDAERGPVPSEDHGEAIQLHEQLRRFRRDLALPGGIVPHGIDFLVGSSPAIRRARAQAELAAGSLSGVLVVGPPGSGRRRLATAIHYGGNPESAGPLVPLDGGLLDAESIRAALRAFAPEGPRGAAGAAKTLLLADADRVPMEVQVELAGILSEAVGSSLRLMATAEAPLLELVRHGRYREDLATVLSTITIELPPLGQRRQDIPLLVQSLLEEGNARGGKQLAGFTSEALDRLDAFPWPGNVGELAQVVAESCSRAVGAEVAAAELPERLHLAAEAAARPRRKEETVVLDDFLARIQRELIRRALARAKGNKAQAARLLGLNRPRLYRRMAQLGLLEEE
jgi:transcriptional regulator of acetoin/glycerol metabolism